jgi:hypothetical protein
MTTSFHPITHAQLYDQSYEPITMPFAARRVDRLRAIAASDYSVSHRLREMLLARISFDAALLGSANREELSIFEQVLAEGQRVGALWMMDDAAIARALLAATNGLVSSDVVTATQVVDLLLQGLVRTTLPAAWEFESKVA